jgi:[NiFe] hydrogenase assembly HybE family chaperone
MTTVGKLTEHYQIIAGERMQQLPIYNPRLTVEAVGFREFQAHQLGVLITPWFMNLVLLPGIPSWNARPTGEVCELALPAGPEEFTVCRDDVLGTYLSAVLFRTMAHFPGQIVTRAIALDVMQRLFQPAPPAAAETKSSISRRDLLRGTGAA